jgi:hypothetical protein
MTLNKSARPSRLPRETSLGQPLNDGALPGTADRHHRQTARLALTYERAGNREEGEGTWLTLT